MTAKLFDSGQIKMRSWDKKQKPVKPIFFEMSLEKGLSTSFSLPVFRFQTRRLPSRLELMRKSSKNSRAVTGASWPAGLPGE